MLWKLCILSIITHNLRKMRCLMSKKHFIKNIKYIAELWLGNTDTPKAVLVVGQFCFLCFAPIDKYPLVKAESLRRYLFPFVEHF